MNTIVGVWHDPMQVNTLIWYLSKAYNPQKVLVELPPTIEATGRTARVRYPFFKPIEDHYLSEGITVIRGDLERVENATIGRGFAAFERLEEAMGDLDNGKRIDVREVMSLNVDFWKGWWSAAKHNILNPARNQGLARSISTHRPDLVVVGDAHARYLARAFPQYDYVRCTNKKPGPLSSALDTILRRATPKETLCLPDLEAQRFEECLAYSNRHIREWFDAMTVQAEEEKTNPVRLQHTDHA